MKHALMIVDFAKVTRQTMDMGGFPEERTSYDKTTVLATTDYNQKQMNDAMKFFTLHEVIPDLQVLANPELTEKQIDKAVIAELQRIDFEAFLDKAGNK